MGNSNSVAEINKGSVQILDVVLKKLPTQTVEEVFTELKGLYLYYDEEIFSLLAKRIYFWATNEKTFCSKYVDLVTQLSALLFVKTSGQWPEIITFKDVFIKQTMKLFDEFRSTCCLMREQEQERHAAFFSELFIQDMVTSTLINHWVKSPPPKLQLLILPLIAQKILSESRKNVQDKAIDSLKENLTLQKALQA